MRVVVSIGSRMKVRPGEVGALWGAAILESV